MESGGGYKVLETDLLDFDTLEDGKYVYYVKFNDDGTLKTDQWTESKNEYFRNICYYLNKYINKIIKDVKDSTLKSGALYINVNCDISCKLDIFSLASSGYYPYLSLHASELQMLPIDFSIESNTYIDRLSRIISANEWNKCDTISSLYNDTINVDSRMSFNLGFNNLLISGITNDTIIYNGIVYATTKRYGRYNSKLEKDIPMYLPDITEYLETLIPNIDTDDSSDYYVDYWVDTTFEYNILMQNMMIIRQISEFKYAVGNYQADITTNLFNGIIKYYRYGFVNSDNIWDGVQYGNIEWKDWHREIKTF